MRMTQIHEDLRREHAFKASSNRSFGLVIGTALALVAFAPLLRHHDVRWWATPIAAIFLLLALAAPGLLAPLNAVWVKLGVLLNRIVSPVVLGVLYFAIFTPMGRVLHLLGKDLLNLRHEATAQSYWVERNPPGPAGETLKNQF